MTVTSDALSAPKADTSTLLDVRNLSVEVDRGHGRRTPIISDVTFTLEEGEILGLVGESGSGKTMTSLAVMRLLPPALRVTEGSILLSGTDVLSLPVPDLRAKRGAEMAMIFQDAMRCLNPAYTVGDQISEPLRIHRGLSKRDALSRAVELLELVEIPRARKCVSSYPHELSGGMCQRVMIAIALSCSPKLLIADEPTTALDVTVQKQILKLLSNIQKEMGLGVLFITHDLGVVAEVCHRTAVMYAGQIVEQGPTRDLFLTPRHPYTDGLISAVPGTDSGDRYFGSIRGSVPQPGSWPTGCRFFERCDAAQAGRCDLGPIPLLGAHQQSQVRCVRAEELTLRGIA